MRLTARDLPSVLRCGALGCSVSVGLLSFAIISSSCPSAIWESGRPLQPGQVCWGLEGGILRTDVRELRQGGWQGNATVQANGWQGYGILARIDSCCCARLWLALLLLALCNSAVVVAPLPYMYRYLMWRPGSVSAATSCCATVEARLWSLVELDLVVPRHTRTTHCRAWTSREVDLKLTLVVAGGGLGDLC